MKIKVCAHAYVASQSHWHFQADSIKDAVAQYRDDVDELYRGPEVGGERGGMDLYPQCDASDDFQCSSMECYHDYPIVRWSIGPRGGLRKERV